MADEPHMDEQADPDWFREPNRRERWIATALFVGFAFFFAMLFFVLAGWWFRWIILGLGLISLFNGLAHARGARQSREPR